jgi:PAS domain S-box-containing protein
MRRPALGPAAPPHTARSMVEPAEVLRDPTRLAALRETELLDTGPEEAFDRLSRLAARLLRVPLAMVSLVDGERQVAKSLAAAPGAPALPREMPLAHSFCKHAVASGQPLRVGDALEDPRFRDNPAVALGLRAYLGIPLVTRAGHALGTLCVGDGAPREWSPEDVAALSELAGIAVEEIEHRRSEAQARRTEETLLAAEEMFRGIVEQSLAGIYVVQGDRFTYVNPGFAEIFGYPREVLMGGMHVLEIVREEDRESAAAGLTRRMREEDSTFRAAFRGRRADGGTVHVEVHGTRADVDGTPAIIGVVLDVSERVRAEGEREAATAARDRFYAMVSHELRTPISAIMLYHDLLLTEVYGALDAAQREALERAQRSAEHLLELINDLLDLSKLQAGKMQPRVEEVDVAELVDTVFLSVAPLAREYGSELSLHVLRRPLPVLGDARRIRQILLNLISNAVKFGEGHPVEVRAGQNGGGVVVEVADHGRGIAPGDVPRIFEDFVQLGDGSDEGTGLGLPIARRLAVLLGGSLEVDSEPGVGSTFRLFLPADS